MSSNSSSPHNEEDDDDGGRGDEDPFPSDESEFSRSSSPLDSAHETPEQLTRGPGTQSSPPSRSQQLSLTARKSKSSLSNANFAQRRAKRNFPLYQNGLAKQPAKDPSILEKASMARRFKVNDLQNEIKLLNQKIKELESENKLLKRTQRRQSVALKRYEGNEGELPMLMRCHEEEVRSLRDQLRKTSEKYRLADRTVRERTVELERTRLQLQRLQSVVREQCIGERNALGKKAETLQAELTNKDKIIQELQRRLELTDKNYKHQLSIEFARHKETKSKMTELGKHADKLRMALKERERELEIRNIYTSRMTRSPRLLNNSAPRVAVATKVIQQRKEKESKRDSEPNKNTYEDNLQTNLPSLNANDTVHLQHTRQNQNVPDISLSENFELFDANDDRLENDGIEQPESLLMEQYIKDAENDNSSKDASEPGIQNTTYVLTDEEISSLSKSLQLPHISFGTSNKDTSLPPVDSYSMSPVRSRHGRRVSIGDQDSQSFWSSRQAEDDVSPTVGLPPAFANKAGKSNLMRQLFGSLEKATYHGKSDATSKLKEETHDSRMDKFIDLFNNNMPSTHLVSKQGRERSTVFQKGVTKNIPSLFDDDGTSVLF